jgi:nucleoside-diphosphate-sugar epimerase
VSGTTPERVLVTGAGGLLGRRVVETLHARGVAVTALELVERNDLDVDRFVVGDAADVDVVRRALEGVDAVVHLAAIRSPFAAPAEEVFCGNTTATFTVLEQAAQAGVRRAVIASSLAISGLPFAATRRLPAYLPIDEELPLQIEDPYALSKQVDELVARSMWWQHGLSVVALRFPFLGGLDEELPKRAEVIAGDPSFAAGELWMYLETRDAAKACTLALSAAPPGFHVVVLAAPNTLAPYSTAQLLDAYHPTVPHRTTFEGRMAPIDVSRARSVLGWEPDHLWTTGERDLDELGLTLVDGAYMRARK